MAKHSPRQSLVAEQTQKPSSRADTKTDQGRQEEDLGGETKAEAIWQTELTDRSSGLKEN